MAEAPGEPLAASPGPPGELRELLPAEYTEPVSLVAFRVAVVPKPLGNQLLKLLQSCCPFDLDLIHLKRVRRAAEEGKLEVLVCPLEAALPNEVTEFLNANGCARRESAVPRRGALTRLQLADFSQHWPLTFRKPSLEPLELPDDLRNKYAKLLERAWDVAARANAKSGCVIVDRKGNELAASAEASTPERPLRHSVMVAIEAAVLARAHATPPPGSKRPHPDDDYLCCDCEVVTTHEPCIMCSMALVHSRVRLVAYQEQDEDFGGLGGKVSLHTCATLNHQLRVLKWPSGTARQLPPGSKWPSCCS